MTRLRLPAVAVACLMLMSSGCSLQRSRDERDPADPVASVSLDEGRAGVRESAAELLGSLTATDSPLATRGVDLAFADGAWGICTDDAEAFAYDVSARIDLEGSDSSSTARDAIEQALAQAGWAVDDEPRIGSPETSITAASGDYRARVFVNDVEPLFSVKVFGVCQLVTADERDRLRQVGPEPLEPTA